jgi:hypothetical protein
MEFESIEGPDTFFLTCRAESAAPSKTDIDKTAPSIDAAIGCTDSTGELLNVPRRQEATLRT